MRTKIYEVKTLEDAKKQAVLEFCINENDLKFEVISEKKGFLGIGGKLEVQVTINVDGAARGKEYIQMILEAHGIEGFVEKKVRDDVVEYNIDAGDYNGYLIGKGSRNLMALQTLVSIIVNNYYDGETAKKVSVDVGDYKKRRISQLERMAVQFGKQVARTKQTIKLDYLNAYERKIVHNKLSTWTDVNTHSEGEEPNRYLIIEPKK